MQVRHNRAASLAMIFVLGAAAITFAIPHVHGEGDSAGFSASCLLCPVLSSFTAFEEAQKPGLPSLEVEAPAILGLPVTAPRFRPTAVPAQRAPPLG